MSYLTYCTLGFLLGYSHSAFSNPTNYDQRQTGDVNVQVHLKDVQVIALVDSGLLEDYTDYDYAYDYSDFTLKPITKPTTSAPNSSSELATTWPTKEPNSTTPIVESTKINATDSTTTTSINSTSVQEETTTKSSEEITTKSSEEITTKLSEETSKSDEKNDDQSTQTTSQPGLRKSCNAPYFLDKKGRCRSLKNRRRFSFVPFAVKMGSRLSERGHVSMRKDLPAGV